MTGRSAVILSDDTWHRCTVVSTVVHYVPVHCVDALGKERVYHCVHKTALVHIDGEDRPRRVDIMRLREYTRERVPPEMSP